MRKGGRARLLACCAAMLVPSFTVACNAILGNEERQIDQRGERDQKSPSNNDTGATNDGPGEDTKVIPDAGVPDDGAPKPLTIVVPNTWESRNLAQFGNVDGGVTITGLTAPASHPMIVPKPTPTIPSDNYTVEAVIRAPTNGEWGLMVRVAADGSGALLGSNFGGSQKPFTGVMGPPDFNPTLQGQGPAYVYTTGARYRMRLKVEGTQTSGKIWEVGQPEPSGFQVTGTAPANGARDVGYYVYNTFDTVLESMTITVP